MEIIHLDKAKNIYTLIKRVIDFAIALSVLVLLLPIWLIVMLILKLTGEGEIFYKQERLGYKNRRFEIWKFATMLKDSPNIGTADITVKNDPRVTTFGKFLRITKINELPQLFNILKGDMSFVGPRPLMENGFNDYPDYVQKRIYNVKPGLTGAGSVIFRHEEVHLTKIDLPPREAYRLVIQPYKGELELWYILNQSFKTDLLLLFLTVWVILLPGSELPYKIFSDLPKPNSVKVVDERALVM